MSELICFGCKQEFNLNEREPRVLPSCGHTYCANCIKSWLEGQKQIVCPEDKVEFLLEKVDGLGSFPKNIALGRLLSEKARQAEPAVQPEQEVQGLHFCLEHKKTADLVCMTDHLIICADCVLFGEHKSHNYKRGTEFLKDARQKLELTKIELAALRQNPLLTNSDKKLADARELVKAKQDELSQKVGEYFETLIRKLRERETTVRQELIEKMGFLTNLLNSFDASIKKIAEKEYQLVNKIRTLNEQIDSKFPDFQKVIEGLFDSADPINGIGDILGDLRKTERDYNEVLLTQINSVSLQSNLAQDIQIVERIPGPEFSGAALPKVGALKSLKEDRNAAEKVADDDLIDEGFNTPGGPLLDDRDTGNLVEGLDSPQVTLRSKPLVRDQRLSSGPEPNLYTSKSDIMATNIYGPERRSGNMYISQKMPDSIYSKPIIGKPNHLLASREDPKMGSQKLNLSLGQAFQPSSYQPASNYQFETGPTNLRKTSRPQTGLDGTQSILNSLKGDDLRAKREEEAMDFSGLHMNDMKLANVLNDVMRNKAVRKLNLDNNKITPSGFETLLKKLVGHENIEKVSLSNNMLDDSVFQMLEDYAAKLKALKAFILLNNKGIKLTAKVKKITASLKKSGFTIEF